VKLLPYYKEEINDKILITNWQGGWLLLTKEQYKKILENDLDESLKFLLEEEGFFGVKKELIRERFKQLVLGTSLHIITLTRECNLNCKYCFVNRSAKRMNIETARKVVDFIFQSPSKSLTLEFTGGEPLLNFEVLKFIVEYAKEKNLKFKKRLLFTITTNGTIFSKEIVDYLKKNNFSVTVSIDGPKEVHEFNRGNNFNLVISNIKKYQEKGLNLSFLPVITKKSIEKWKEVVDFFVFELGSKEIHWKYLYPPYHNPQIWEEVGYSAEEFFESWKKVINYLLKLNEEGIIIRERIASVLLTKILKKKNPLYTEIMSPCGAVITQISYDYNGDIYTCDEAKGIDELKLGNVFENHYNEIRTCSLTKEIISISSNSSYSCEMCAFNPWCGTCVVENIIRENNLFSHVPSSFRHKVLYNQFKYLFELIDRKFDLIKKWV
jgi:radical SAM protein with 4Fe4S-binding SPASM domain